MAQFGNCSHIWTYWASPDFICANIKPNVLYLCKHEIWCVASVQIMDLWCHICLSLWHDVSNLCRYRSSLSYCFKFVQMQDLVCHISSNAGSNVSILSNARSNVSNSCRCWTPCVEFVQMPDLMCWFCANDGANVLNMCKSRT